MTDFPIDDVRSSFPALCGVDKDRRIYLDGPGGTQICAQAIRAMVAHFEGGTANAGGAFATSREVDAMTAAAHEAMADLLGAARDEIAFGPNMTSLTFAASRALARNWHEGDELVVTRLDHDANIAPWLAVARDKGMVVRWLDFDPDTGVLDYAALPGLLGPRTRLVAVGGASNAIGTLNEIERISAIVKAHSEALLFVDAVQSVPHVVTDVATLQCDMLACSPYKFFGPHQGVLWGRPEVMAKLRPYKVRPAADDPPARRFETGTPSMEGQAGVLGTIGYFEELGARFAPTAATRRERLVSAISACHAYEKELSKQLLDGLRSLPRIRLWGPPTTADRVPTFGLTIEGVTPRAAADALAARDIYAWAGHFYAVEAVARMGLAEKGGLLRLGLGHYNTASEVDHTLKSLAAL